MFTICMDVIDSAFAPGVSSPSVLGLYPHSVFEISKRVILSDKVSSLVLQKLPDYDVDNRTSKLGEFNPSFPSLKSRIKLSYMTLKMEDDDNP